MDAIRLLEDDHKAVKKLLDELESTTERGVKTREELFARIKRDLNAHEVIEEEIFYPALKEHAEAKEIVIEGYIEHNMADELLADLDATPVDDEKWGPTAKVMKESIEHHIEEEEGEMFSIARKVLEDDELETLGERMGARKKEILG